MAGTRRPAPVDRPVALTIAGSDSGGGAGIQADLKTMEAFGAFGTSAITSVTAQHSRGVESTHPVPVEEIEAQIDAVRSDFDLRAAKTGMLGVEPVVETAARYAAEMSIPFVVDPVMVAASGDRLLDPAAESAYEALIDEATVVTPNADEAEILTGTAIRGRTSMRKAGELIVEMGAEAALVKGGHAASDADVVADVLVTSGETHTFEHPRIETDATHGAGCTLSSAIAARLAHGEDLLDAVADGVQFMQRALRYPLAVGRGPGAVHHLAEIRNRAAGKRTQESVESVIDRLVEADARALVPEVGTNVVGATPMAETQDDVVAVEGRISATRSGIRANRGTRFGASSHVARFLLSAREFDPDLRFAANVRFDESIEEALESLDGPTVEVDRSGEPAPDVEGSTMDWVAQRAFDAVSATPAAVYDRGDVGKESMVRLLADDAEVLGNRAIALLEHR